jgi:uncharacterized BrkB/YihY/UPF0761 family membrane protein
MKSLKIVFGVLVIFVGLTAAAFCGTFAPILVGEKNPKYHPMGLWFGVVTLVGLGLAILGFAILFRAAKDRQPSESGPQS